MTGSTPNPDIDLQKKLFEVQFSAAIVSEKRAKRENERKKKEHRARIVSLTGTTLKFNKFKSETPLQIFKVSKFFFNIP